MQLKKNGITFEVIHPQDIARLKRAGYVEVKEVVQPEAPSNTEQPPAELTVAPEEQATATLAILTVAELRELAAERGLEGFSNLKKADLVALLEQGGES